MYVSMGCYTVATHTPDHWCCVILLSSTLPRMARSPNGRAGELPVIVSLCLKCFIRTTQRPPGVKFS